MSKPVLLQIIGAQVTCTDGMQDKWREVWIWLAGELRARFGDGVQVKYYDLFDANCSPMPAEAQLPLVMVEAEAVRSGRKISVPVIRRKVEEMMEKETKEVLAFAHR